MRGFAIASVFGVLLWGLMAALPVRWMLQSGPAAAYIHHSHAGHVDVETVADTQHGLGWHPPTDHEHGDAPPAWVSASPWAPFTQSRQVHQGYKGFLAPMQPAASGVECYLIAHILSTAQARSVAWHDYQLWCKESPSGVVSHWAGGAVGNAMDFGSPTRQLTDQVTALPKPIPVPSMSQDTSLYPGQQESKFAESWDTNSPATVFALSWYLLSYNQEMVLNEGGNVVEGAVGAFRGHGHLRGMNFLLIGNRLPGPGAVSVSPTLAGRCGPVCSYRDLTHLRDYCPSPGTRGRTCPGFAVPN